MKGTKTIGISVLIALIFGCFAVDVIAGEGAASKINFKGAIDATKNAFASIKESSKGKKKKSKPVKIKLTGSIYEPVRVTIGQTGHKEEITSLPYILEVDKANLPLRLHFESKAYEYYDIDVPEKPYDTTGHVYLVKVNETAMASRNAPKTPATGTYASTNDSHDIVEKKSTFNPKKGVNSAPVTHVKNENTFVLIISNEDYEMAAKVDNATNDGLAFKEYCNKTLGIPEENIRYSENLTYGKMRKAFLDVLDLANVLEGEANVILYYAGHGIPDNKSKDAFLLPIDADGTDTSVCVSLERLYNRINEANINRCIAFIDACFSGAQRGGDMIVAARGVRLKPKEIKPTGKTIIFSATSEDEAAYSHKQEEHGLFTYYLLAKLQETKGKVTLGELAKYIKQKVALESRRVNNSPQTPKVSVGSNFETTWEKMSLVK